MEEILASIKRVIAEDGRAASSRPARGSRPVEAPKPAEEDILELSNPVSEEEDGLLSGDAAAASRQSLAVLSALRERSEPAPTADEGPLEAVVRDMLKPMLKDWLDRHLPEIVEEIVAREVSRITGRTL